MEDQMKSELEGVTLKFYLYSKPSAKGNLKSINTIEDFVDKLVSPYNAIIAKYNVKANNKIILGSIHGYDSAIILNIRCPPSKLEKALEFLFKNYGLPFAIYKPNRFFRESDTDQGTEIAKNLILRMGGKVRKRSLLYFDTFLADEKYFVSKRKEP